MDENQSCASRYVKFTRDLKAADRALTDATNKVNDIRSTLDALNKTLAKSVGANIQQKLFKAESGFCVMVRYHSENCTYVTVFDEEGQEVR